MPEAAAQTSTEQALLAAARTRLITALEAEYGKAALGDLADFVNGTSYRSDLVGFGGTPIVRISNITNPAGEYLRTSEEFAERFMVTPGDLLVSWSASFKTIIWPGPAGVLNQHIFRVTPHAGVDKSYVRHAIEAAFEDLRQHQVGIGMMHLRRGDFLGHHVAEPPTPVQAQVAAFLDWIEGGRRGPAPVLPASLAEVAVGLLALGENLDRVAVAQTERASIRATSQRLLRAVLAEAETVPTPLHELLRRRPLDVDVDQSEAYQFAGVYSFGRGVFRATQKHGSEFSYTQLTRLRAGDFTYPKLMAWEGALGVVPAECDGMVVSPEFPVFEVDEQRVLPEVLDVYFKDPAVWPKLQGSSTGTNVRRRRLNPKDFLAFEFPLPPMPVQRRLQRATRLVAQLELELNAAAGAYAALVPSLMHEAAEVA